MVIAWPVMKEKPNTAMIEATISTAEMIRGIIVGESGFPSGEAGSAGIANVTVIQWVVIEHFA